LLPTITFTAFPNFPEWRGSCNRTRRDTQRKLGRRARSARSRKRVSYAGLKAETTRPPKKDLRAQQRRFDAFRHVFNEERPHEALDLETPASVYRPSSRPLPTRPMDVSYPPHFEVRLISQDKTIRWKNQKVFVSNLLKREHIGLEEVGDGLWSVYFGPVHLGWLDEQDYRIMDVLGHRRRL
jgi:hypothetical protein